jgi:hypothetical protein
MAALLGCFGMFMGGYWYAQGGWVMAVSPVGIGAVFVLAAVMDAYRARPTQKEG